MSRSQQREFLRIRRALNGRDVVHGAAVPFPTPIAKAERRHILKMRAEAARFRKAID
jgi:hypothetical protein